MVSSEVMRLLMSPYNSKFALNETTPCCLVSSRNLNAGAPIGMPSALASLLRDTAQPSLLLRTTTGFPSRSGRNRRSQLTKKLLQSTNANIVIALDGSHG